MEVCHLDRPIQHLDRPIQHLDIWFIAASCMLRAEQVRDKVHLTF